MAPRKQPDRMLTFAGTLEPPDLPDDLDEDIRRRLIGPAVAITAVREDDETDALSADFATVHMPDPWRVTGTARLKAGRLIISRLTLEPQPYWQSPNGIVRQDEKDAPERGVTSGLLRSIHVGRLTSAVRVALEHLPEVAEQRAALSGEPRFADPEFLGVARKVAAALPDPPKRGRQGYGDEFYRQVALLYLKLQEAGWGRGILREIARLKERPRDTVSTWVRQARLRGFLTAGTPGRAGASPGPRLRVSDDEDADRESTAPEQ